ncbi:MAG TPA: GAF domain-containing protein [Longilinea sp.]|nr:GAF domain-containing protein [Longilinea sp.]
MSSQVEKSTPDWKKFLQLGEKLLAEPLASVQQDLIESTIRQILKARAVVWLAEPYYPLPGQVDVKTIPAQKMPPLVAKAFKNHRCCYQDTASDKISTRNPIVSDQVALPLMAHNDLLGIVEAHRPASHPFSTEELHFLDGLTSNAALSMQITRQIAIKNWRSEQLALVQTVSNQIANLVDLDDLSLQVTHLIQDTFHYYYVAVFIAEDSKLTLAGDTLTQPDSKSSPIKINAQWGEGMVGTTAEKGVELVAQDVKLEPSYCYVDLLPDTKSEATIPLKIENRVLGVMDVQSDQLDAFHEFDIVLLRSLADNIALAIENSRIYSHLLQRADQIAAVLDVSHALNSILDPDLLLQEIVRLIHDRFGYPFVHLFTVQPDTKKVIYRAGSGPRSGVFLREQVAYNVDDPLGIIPWVARTGKSLLANDVSAEPLYRPANMFPSGTKSELAVPLSLGDNVLGVLDMQSDQQGRFNDEDRTLIEALAASIAVTLRNASLYRSEQWRRQVADSFRDVARLLSSNSPLENLLETILDKLEANLPCDASAIWLLEEPQLQEHALGQELELAAVHGVDAEKIIRMRREAPDIRQWLDSTLTVAEPSIRKPGDPFGPLGAALDYPSDYSSIAAPLRSGNQMLGTLSLAYHDPGRYGPEASAIVATFASYAAVAIQNARTYANAQAQAWSSTVLLQVAQAVQEMSSLEDLLETMARLTPLLVGMKQCAFFLWDEGLGGFVYETGHGLELPAKGTLSKLDNSQAFARLAAQKSTLFLQDAGKDLNLSLGDLQPGKNTQVLIPLVAHDELLGAFLVIHQQPAERGAGTGFDDRTLAILHGIANQTATAIENIKLLEARQEDSYVTAVLLQVAQAVVSQNSLDDILENILHLLPILIGIDACILYDWDKQQDTFTPLKAIFSDQTQETAVLARNYPASTAPLLAAIARQDTMAFCTLENRSVPPTRWPSLSCAEPGTTPSREDQMKGTLLLGFPISVKGEVLGVLLAWEQQIPLQFHEKRVEIMNGVAQQIALAIQNNRLEQEKAGQERLQQELQLARRIQETFLPTHLPEMPGWELDMRWQTARQVGGDFYDVIRLHKNRLALVIADVSDKGIPAALYMTVVRTLIRAYAQNSDSPAAVLRHVNSLLYRNTPDGMFVTTAMVMLDAGSGRLTYANAGHCLPLHYHAASRKITALPKGGIALGVLDDVRYQEYPIQIDSKDSLIFYTDGVTECFSPNGETFGENRLYRAILKQKGKSICDMLESIETSLVAFRQTEPISDDITIIAAQRL